MHTHTHTNTQTHTRGCTHRIAVKRSAKVKVARLHCGNEVGSVHEVWVWVAAAKVWQWNSVDDRARRCPQLILQDALRIGPSNTCVRVRVCACVRVRVCACVRACVRERVLASFSISSTHRYTDAQTHRHRHAHTTRAPALQKQKLANRGGSRCACGKKGRRRDRGAGQSQTASS